MNSAICFEPFLRGTFSYECVPFFFFFFSSPLQRCDWTTFQLTCLGEKAAGCWQSLVFFIRCRKPRVADKNGDNIIGSRKRCFFSRERRDIIAFILLCIFNEEIRSPVHSSYFNKEGGLFCC